MKHTDQIGFINVLNALNRCLILVVSIICLGATNTKAQHEVSVGLFNRIKIDEVMISPSSGSYMVLNGRSDTLYRFRSDDAVSVKRIVDGILIKSIFGFSDTLDAVNILSPDRNPNLKLKLAGKQETLAFFNDIRITTTADGLKLINAADIESYVSRVVQGEVGYGAATEYYKIQSIICRTYAYRNMRRHEAEGYDLCDHEHCQVYSGTLSATNEVKKATAATSGLVMVDPNENLVLSAFHSNCGGQTANSEDVWKESRSYLTSVLDTFCLSARSANWEKRIPKSEFLNQLGIDVSVDSLVDFNFEQRFRKKNFSLGESTILLSKMRTLLRLRSTFFDLISVGDDFVLDGRGYGHGVGLCQQGAMKMAESGYDHSQILGYYYKGISLIDHERLKVE